MYKAIVNLTQRAAPMPVQYSIVYFDFSGQVMDPCACILHLSIYYLYNINGEFYKLFHYPIYTNALHGFSSAIETKNYSIWYNQFLEKPDYQQKNSMIKHNDISISKQLISYKFVYQLRLMMGDWTRRTWVSFVAWHGWHVYLADVTNAADMVDMELQSNNRHQNPLGIVHILYQTLHRYHSGRIRYQFDITIHKNLISVQCNMIFEVFPSMSYSLIQGFMRFMRH